MCLCERIERLIDTFDFTKITQREKARKMKKFSSLLILAVMAKCIPITPNCEENLNIDVDYFQDSIHDCTTNYQCAKTNSSHRCSSHNGKAR